MNLNFPSRFLKKLEVYQQVRSGQGISKHKHLWKYEAAFLQSSYGKDHQHLSNFFNTEDVMENIGKIEQDYPRKEQHHILTNLFWRGYIDVVKKDGEKKVTKEKLLDRSSEAFTSDVIKNKKNIKDYGYRPTKEGLLIGEVLTEINNKSFLLKFLNNYKYSLVLDTIWFLGIFALVKLMLPENLWKNVIEKYHVSMRGVTLDYTHILLLAVFVIWPFAAYLLRKLYLVMEGSDE